MVECYNLSIELFFRKKDARINYEKYCFSHIWLNQEIWNIQKRFILIGSLFKILYNTIISY
jgi:hypothetical protein